MSDKFSDHNPPWKDLAPKPLEAEDAKIVCSWCRVVMHEGDLPASHGICPRCAAELNAEMDAKYGVTGYGWGV
jgi:uncharacterized paraquat-inducible protein A